MPRESHYDGLRVFEAQYDGPCGLDCGRRIEPGDQIVWIDDEVCHAGCAEDAGEEVDRT